jgi:hypothetical protein
VLLVEAPPLSHPCLLQSSPRWVLPVLPDSAVARHCCDMSACYRDAAAQLVCSQAFCVFADTAFQWGVRVGVVAPTTPEQRGALVELYIATNGSNWSSKTGWQDHTAGSDPCDNSWSGVTCSGSGGSANRGV